MSLLTDAYDRNVKGGSLKRKKWDPIDKFQTWLSSKFSNESDDDYFDEDDDVKKPLMKAGDIDPNANLKQFQDKRRKKRGRLFHNLVKKGGASNLTY